MCILKKCVEVGLKYSVYSLAAHVCTFRIVQKVAETEPEREEVKISY
jgi:hypothetical protein